MTRDDCGGAVGVRWTTATRDGRTFATRAAERLLEGGCRLDGKRYSLTPVGAATFQLTEST